MPEKTDQQGFASLTFNVVKLDFDDREVPENECSECKGTGTVGVHLLNLQTRKYEGEWTVLSPCGCPSIVMYANYGRDLVKILKATKDLDVRVFDTKADLDSWVKAREVLVIPPGKGIKIDLKYDQDGPLTEG